MGVVGRTRSTAKARKRGAAVALSLGAGAAVLLSACSSAGNSLAQQACTHVDASIGFYMKAEHATSDAAAHRDARRALRQLSQAVPLAARATSDDPVYNPLMVTLERSGQTSEKNLIPALRAQCSAANNPSSLSTPPAPHGVPGGGAVPGTSGSGT